MHAPSAASAQSPNARMVSHLVAQRMADQRVALAMGRVDRAHFVPKAVKQMAYSNSPIPLFQGQTMSAPEMVAHMSTLLNVKPGMNILDVGSASGYQTAILAELDGKKGKVVAIERHAELFELGRENCLKAGYTSIEFIHGDGTKGYAKEAPYDCILVAAAARTVPKALTDQLKEGGLLIMPVGGPVHQELLLVKKLGLSLHISKTMDVAFVPLIDEG